MLQVIISPAKQMRAAQDAFEVLGIPPFAHETARLHRALLDIERNEGSGGLQALWNVSDKLLGSYLDTLHEFEPILKNDDLDNPDIARNVSPAVMSYHGIQYQSMAPEVMDSARSHGCKATCGSSRAFTDAFAPFMPSNRIGWRWARSSPSTMSVTSMRFGAISSHGLSFRQAQTPRSSTSPA